MLLWQSAARLCLEDPTLSAEDIEDLIGPCEDPSISDCLMVLALAQSIPGCARLDAGLDEIPTAPVHHIATGNSVPILKAVRAS